MIRLILVAIVFILFFTITLPLYIILLFLKKRHPVGVAKVAQPVVCFGFKLVLLAGGIRVDVSGTENIPDRPVLYATNHRSICDIPIVYTTTKQRTGIIAKKETAKIPFLSWWMRLLNCLFLDRDDIKQALKTVLTGIELIKGGSSMCIMPEGTRNHEPEMLPFKEGSFKMAEKTGCPIVPVALWKTDETFELHKPFIKAQKVKIRYCEPVILSELDKETQKHVGVLVREKIDEALKEMRG